METVKTRKIVIGGVLLALSAATLFGASFIPGIELTLYALSSVYVVIMIIEFSPSAGWLFYFASLLLSFVLIPNKAAIVPYAIFFGVYAIVKYYIESTKKLHQAVEIILKLVFGNLMFTMGFLLFGTAFTGVIQIPDLALPVLAVGVQIFILVYDYILTLVIGFYLKRRPKSQT